MCPYCLTEIILQDESSVTCDAPEETFETEEAEELEDAEAEETVDVEEQVEPPESPSECTHHLGYLSEKSSKEKIPDECMMCKDIVTCMLKKMKA